MENIKAKIQAILMNNSQKSVIGWAVEEDDFEEVAEEIVKNCFIPNVVVEPPKINSKDFKDWLKSEGYKNKGFGIYQKENKDCCYQLLYKHYCKIQELGN